jgi:single-strand DNA-binding protein
MYQRVILIGRLGKDIELKYLASGDAVANTTLATTKTFTKNGTKQTQTEWHNLSVFGKTAEICNQFIGKGSLVMVEGELHTRSWEKDGVKHYQTGINVSEIKFLDQKKKQESNLQDVEEAPFSAQDILF